MLQKPAIFLVSAPQKTKAAFKIIICDVKKWLELKTISEFLAAKILLYLNLFLNFTIIIKKSKDLFKGENRSTQNTGRKPLQTGNRVQEMVDLRFRGCLQ